MSVSSEVITVQCGHYSNFIGTHLWNLQESCFDYDGSSSFPQDIINDVTFREGLTITGEQTYTPRLIALDLPGSLKTLREEGELYVRSAPEASSWQGGCETHEQTIPTKNEFLAHLDAVDAGKIPVEVVDSHQYDLQSSVEVWSDFLRIHLHPKSLLLVPGHSHPVSDGGFSVHPAGLKVWESREFREAVEDKLHFFTEECDRLQGFQLLVDWDDGFGGLASCLAQELADDYSSKDLISFAASPLAQPLDQLPAYRATVLNHSLALARLCEHSSVVCPLSQLTNPWRVPVTTRLPPTINYEASLPYHSSCLFATAIDTASLLYRTEQSPSLAALTARLSPMGRKVCGLCLALPLSLPGGSTLVTELDHTPLHSRLCPLTPFADHKETNKWSQVIVVRGIPSDYPLCNREAGHSDASRVLAHHLSDCFPNVNTQLCVVGKPLAIKSPYPNILPAEYHKNQKAPVCASFQTTPSTYQLLSTVTSELKAINVRRLPVFSTSCLDDDSCLELTHELSRLRDCYRTGPHHNSGSSDSD